MMPKAEYKTKIATNPKKIMISAGILKKYIIFILIFSLCYQISGLFIIIWPSQTIKMISEGQLVLLRLSNNFVKYYQELLQIHLNY